MRNIASPYISYLQFTNLADQGYLCHGVSMRGRANGLECNFSRRDPSLADESQKLFCDALGLQAHTLVGHTQVHGSRIAVVTEPGQSVGAADGICTNRFDIALMLLGADCPLLIVYDTSSPAVGLAHAGWRGTVQQIAIGLVETMKMEFGSRTENMQVGIGPGICKHCYLVGEEVMLIALLNLRRTTGLFRPGPFKSEGGPDCWYFDLIEANRRTFLETGIPAKNIETSGYCTYERTDLFPSYRREGESAGRWALMAGLKKFGNKKRVLI